MKRLWAEQVAGSAIENVLVVGVIALAMVMVAGLMGLVTQ